MKILKNLILASVVSFSTVALASKPNDTKSNDYYANYYEDEGSLLFKIRGFYVATNSKINNFSPSSPNPNASKPSSLANSGYGFDTAMTIFVTNNIAAEISLGFGFYKTKSSDLSTVAVAYGNPNAATGKRNQIFMFPVTFTAQYHIAPFGAIRPYVGAGLSGTYMYTRSHAIKATSGFGPVLQTGMDFVAKDDTLFNLDIKQYFLKSKVTFKKGFLGTNKDVTSKVTLNPLVISAGIGFKF
jgi:outer membrane protein